MKVLFDTNVVLDVLLDRKPFSKFAISLFGCSEQGTIKGYLCATIITTIHYLATKVVGSKQAKMEIQKLLQLFAIAPVQKSVIDQALSSDFDDFEDGVLNAAAEIAGIEAIVTRNIKDFGRSKLHVYEPSELAGILKTSSRI